MESLLVVRGALVLAVMLGTSTFVSAAPAGIDLDAKLSDLQAARILVEAGRFAHARVLLERARPANEGEQIERLFLLGRAEVRLGLPVKAAERFEAILALRPWLTRVRLELAQAYFMSGRNDRARAAFIASLEDRLPSSVASVREGTSRVSEPERRGSPPCRSGPALSEASR